MKKFCYLRFYRFFLISHFNQFALQKLNQLIKYQIKNDEIIRIQELQKSSHIQIEKMNQNVQEVILVQSCKQISKNQPQYQQKSLSQIHCCRICLQDMKNQQIFSSCNCKGSNGYVHQNCLLQWIKKSKRYKDSFRTYFYVCDICRSRIFLQTTVTCRCITFQELKHELLDKEICCTLTTIIFLFLSFIVLGIVIYVSSLSKDTSSRVIYIIGLIITLVTIGITIGIYIFNYVLKFETLTVGIQKRSLKNHHGTKISPQTNNTFDNNASILQNLAQKRKQHHIQRANLQITRVQLLIH